MNPNELHHLATNSIHSYKTPPGHAHLKGEKETEGVLQYTVLA